MKNLMKANLSLLTIAALLLSACASLQPISTPITNSASVMATSVIDLTEVLPQNPAVRTGILENGLTYLIRYNSEPKNRAELWLAVNAGSLQEDEDQRGIAHFLEHMLFNGTKRFPAMEAVDFLENIGMEFGPGVNAYTSFDETVYTIQVPTDDTETLNTAFDIIEDWAGAATLDLEEINKERNVIVEEWRLDNETASGRIRNQTLPAILGDSRYTNRRPIGDMDIVRNASPETLKRFYETWYRPDLMTVIAVGDFDVDKIETMIQEHFSRLTNPENAPQRQFYNIPATDCTNYLIVTDPEETQTEIQIWHKRASQPIHTGFDYRDELIRHLFYWALNERLVDIKRQPDAPFLSVQTEFDKYVRPLDIDVAVIQVDGNRVETGLDALLTEIERMRRYGVTINELERAKQEAITISENALKEHDNFDSSSLADDYLKCLFIGDAAPGIEYEHELIKQVLPTITADEVNAVAVYLSSPDNRVIIVTAPEKDDTVVPTQDKLVAVVNALATKDIDAPEEKISASKLLDVIPEPVTIVFEVEIPEVGITEIKLENGIRVLLKPTDFMNDEILFTGFSLGGSSLVSDEDYPETTSIVDVISESGVADFGQSELEKVLAGKNISITPYIGELTEGIVGSSSVDDIETLFQLIYLYTSQPRVDKNAFEVFKKQRIAALKNRALDPEAAFSNAVTEALYGDIIRYGELPIEAIESLDLNRAFDIYKDRYADFDDAVFIFVGNVDVDRIKKLSQRYLGNLPTTDREESWQDVTPDLPEGIVETNVFKGEGDLGIVQVVFTGPYEPSLEFDVTINAVESVLDIMIREELRDNLGGVYESGVGSFVHPLPEPVYTAYVYFDSDPDRVDELIKVMFALIDDIQRNGPSEENLNKAKSIALRQHEESMKQNESWLNLIENSEIFDDEEVEDAFRTTKVIDALTAEDIQAAAQELLNRDRYVKIVLLPESYK